MNIPKKPNRRQREFHQDIKHEAGYEAKDEKDAIRTMCMDAILHTLEFAGSHAVIFTRTPDDCEAVTRAVKSLAAKAADCEIDGSYVDVRWRHDGTIAVKCISDDIEDLWRHAGSEWNWMYFYKKELFTERQYGYLRTRARSYPRSDIYSVRSITIRT